jgi:hypothetical protein
MPLLANVISSDVIANRPVANSAGRLFFATDTKQTFRDNGTSWDEVSDKGIVTSVAGRTGSVVIAEADVTGLVSDLGLKAPLASPALTGTPTAPTPSTADNSTKIATTAYVKAQTGFSSPLTTKGDIHTYTTTDARLAVGADGTVPTSDSAASPGISYKKQPFAVVFYSPGKPTDTNLLAFTIPKIDGASITVTWAGNFADSYGTSPVTNATSTANIPVSKNGTQFGTISISTSGVFTFTTTSGTAKTAVSGDLIAFGNPLDATMSGFGWTLAATRA